MSKITRRGFARGATPAPGAIIPLALTLSVVFAFSLVSRPLVGQEQGGSRPEFNLTMVGDAIMKTPAQVRQGDPGFMGVVNAVRKGNAGFVNLEGAFPGPSAPPVFKSANWIGLTLQNLKDLQWMGFNIFNNANNHTFDFDMQGLLDTIQLLEQSGVPYAGVGRNLGEARAPAYLSTPVGRVALVASASTIMPQSPAGHARPDMRGRPGLSPLRYQTTFRVDAATLEALRKTKKDLQLSQVLPDTPQTVRLSFPTSVLSSPALTFELGDKPGVITTVDPHDLAELTQSIRDAAGMANYVVAYVHGHEGIPGPDSFEHPAQFLVQYAHAAIDAGADVFVATGPHVLRGIEIYKGKVILYSLGNFIFELDLLTPQPADFYEAQGLGPDALPAELYERRSDHDTTGFHSDIRYWQSVVAQVTFRGGRPVEVTLTPISLGFRQKRPDRGYPRLADSAMATQILERLQKLSSPYGTNIVIKNGVGTIMVGETTPAKVSSGR